MKRDRQSNWMVAATLVALFGTSILATPAWAHLEKPFHVVEGQAGPYPLRVIVRTPGVVPGLAEITVRALGEGVERVTVLPVHWKTGLSGAPSPDEAERVAGEGELFTAELWLMTGGSYSVYIDVTGRHGEGRMIVPVPSLATKRLAMSPAFGAALAGLGLLLCALFVSIHGAAVREATLFPGKKFGRMRLWAARGFMVLVVAGLGLAAAGGYRWWEAVDRDYRLRRMFRAAELQAAVVSETNGDRRILRLGWEVSGGARSYQTGLVPDHGKLMHLFAIRKPDQDAFAHLHPVRQAEGKFAAVLPPLPAGSYELYADVTYESGFAETLTNTVVVPAPHEGERGGQSTVLADAEQELPQSWMAMTEEEESVLVADPDDSWRLGPVLDSGSRVQSLAGGRTIRLELDEPLVVNRDMRLRLVVLNAQGQAAMLRPYLGMFGHAALRHDSGRAFHHLHPVGTVSLAAQQVMQLRDQGKAPEIITAQALEPFCQDPPAEQGREPLHFPCVFSEPGKYRLWVQVRPGEEVETAVFDFEVAPERR